MIKRAWSTGIPYKPLFMFVKKQKQKNTHRNVRKNILFITVIPLCSMNGDVVRFNLKNDGCKPIVDGYLKSSHFSYMKTLKTVALNAG